LKNKKLTVELKVLTRKVMQEKKKKRKKSNLRGKKSNNRRRVRKVNTQQKKVANHKLFKLLRRKMIKKTISHYLSSTARTS